LKQLTETESISRQAAKGKDKTKRNSREKAQRTQKGMTEMTEAWISFSGTVKCEFGTAHF
jgi:hypothetical protein